MLEITRHGSRAPQNLEKCFGDKWPEGPSQLTPSGERQHYLLGQYMRNRYIVKNKFLSETYDPKEIFVYSSDLSRTIMSASAHMTGIYPRTEQF